MKTFKLCRVAACLLFSLFSVSVWAFGASGHRIVAGVAENHLQESCFKKIRGITQGRPLAKIATWPDEIKSDPSWDHAKPWHYINIGDKRSVSSFKHSKRGDILQALERFQTKLENKAIEPQSKWQSLAFYVHFVADIHQPLHVGRKQDRGGNDTQVIWFGSPTNIHAVWDYGLIERQRLSYSEYIEFIDFASAAQIRDWQSTDYADWIDEARALHPQIYDFTPHSKPSATPRLGYPYLDRNRMLIEQLLLKAGLRLAGKLNQICGNL